MASLLEKILPKMCLEQSPDKASLMCTEPKGHLSQHIATDGNARDFHAVFGTWINLSKDKKKWCSLPCPEHTYNCTREAGHKGPHVACSVNKVHVAWGDHEITWPNAVCYAKTPDQAWRCTEPKGHKGDHIAGNKSYPVPITQAYIAWRPLGWEYEDVCGETYSGFYCTRYKGHSGIHVSGDGFKVMGTWKSDELPKSVILNLSCDEAQTLMAICGGCCIGDPLSTRRTHTNAIYAALKKLGFTSNCLDISGHLQFLNLTKKGKQ